MARARVSRYFHAMNRRSSAELAALFVAIAILASGCERPRAPVNGIGGFELARTTLAGVQPHSTQCLEQQNNVTRCWLNARQAIMGRIPQIELDFAGTAPDSVLAEIVLQVPGCQLDQLTSWFEDKLGAPTARSEQKVLWEQKYMVLSAEINGPSRCLITAVAPVDEERVERVKR
jgi:hypothetical protein